MTNLHHSSEMCEKVRPYYYDYLQKTLRQDNTLTWAAEHIDQCAYCQERIAALKTCLESADSCSGGSQLRLQAKNLQGHFGWLNQPVTCQVVKPYLALQTLPELEVSIPTPITVHLNHCRRCREDLQTLCSLNLSPAQLQQWVLTVAAASSTPTNGDKPPRRPDLPNILAQLAQRPDTPVVTTVEMRQNPSDSPDGPISQCYEDWPFRIKVHGQEPMQQPLLYMPVRKAASVMAHRTVSAAGHFVKRTYKPLAAAAVIMLVFGLMLRTSAAGNIGLKAIYNAFSRAEVIHIRQEIPDASAPIQEFWISRTNNAMVLRQKGILSLVDLRRNERIIKDAGDISTRTISQKEAPYLQEMIYTGCGLLPFARMEDIPQTSDWHNITGDITHPALPNTDIYELEWAGPGYMGRELPHKWRCYLEPETNLPLRAERYVFDNMLGDYQLETIITADYTAHSVFATMAAQLTPTLQ